MGPLILLVLGFVLVLLATLKVPEPPRFSYGWGGVACWMLAALFTRF